MRAELCNKLADVPDAGTRVHSFAPDSLTPPTLFVGTMTYNPLATMGDADLSAQVWLAISRASGSARAAEKLDSFVDGANSVPTALEASSTVWDDCTVTGVEFPITIDANSVQFLAARFDLAIYL